MFANHIMNNAMNGFMPNMQMPMAPQMWPQFGIMPQISVTPQPFASSIVNPPTFIQPYSWPHPEPPPPTQPPKPIQIPVTVIFGPDESMSIEGVMTIPDDLRNKIERDEEIVEADLNSMKTKPSILRKEDSKEIAMDKVPFEVKTEEYNQSTAHRRAADPKNEKVEETTTLGNNFTVPPVTTFLESDSHSGEFHHVRFKYNVPIPVPIPYPYPVPDPPPGVPFPFPSDPNDGHQLPRPMHGSLAMQYPLPHFSEPPTYMEAKYTLPWHQAYSFPVTNPETDTESSSEEDECSASKNEK